MSSVAFELSDYLPIMQVNFNFVVAVVWSVCPFAVTGMRYLREVDGYKVEDLGSTLSREGHLSLCCKIQSRLWDHPSLPFEYGTSNNVKLPTEPHPVPMLRLMELCLHLPLRPYIIVTLL